MTVLEQQSTLTQNDEHTSWLLQKCGVPKRYLYANMTDFEQDYDGESMFITGPRGTGKTHLLVALLRKYMPLYFKTNDTIEYQPKFITVPELMLKFKSTFNRKDDSEQEVLNNHSKATMLFLDDLGVEKVSDWSIQMLYLLIDRRYRDMKRTFISSNLSLNDIAEKLDDRIASRIVGMCNILKLTGKDRRLSK